MKSVKCPSCGAKMKRSGKTSAGGQRWRCPGCGASTTVCRDGDAAALREFLGWLMSKGSQRGMPGQGRSVGAGRPGSGRSGRCPSRTASGTACSTSTGFWLARDLVVFICRSDERVVSWYMARSETSRARSALVGPDSRAGRRRLRRRDGLRRRGAAQLAGTGSGGASSTRSAGSGAAPPRAPGSRPGSSPAARGDLLRIGTLHQAELRVERYLQWCGFWADFLEDTSVIDGRRVFTHERLRKARSSLSRLVSEGTLFTYLDPELTEAGPLRSTDNAAESLNARLRDMLRNHRGMSLMRRVKAVFWWCRMHSGDARTAAEKLAVPCRPTRTSTSSTARTPPPRSARTAARSGGLGRVGGAPPQGPVPLVARLTDGNARFIGTHFLSYNPHSRP